MAGETPGHAIRVLHVPACSGDVLPSGGLVCPILDQNVKHCVFHSTWYPEMHFMCLSSYQSLFLTLTLEDTSTNLLLLTPGSRYAEAQTDLLCHHRTSSVGKFPCVQVHELVVNFSAVEESKGEPVRFKVYSNNYYYYFIIIYINTRTQELERRKEDVHELLCNYVQARPECFLLSASKLTSFSQFRYVYMSGSEEQPYP